MPICNIKLSKIYIFYVLIIQHFINTQVVGLIAVIQERENDLVFIKNIDGLKKEDETETNYGPLSSPRFPNKKPFILRMQKNK